MFAHMEVAGSRLKGHAVARAMSERTREVLDDLETEPAHDRRRFMKEANAQDNVKDAKRRFDEVDSEFKKVEE